MGTMITGPDPAQAAQWPIIRKTAASGDTRSAGDALIGGTYPSLLADGLDTTYIWEKGPNVYYRVNILPFNLPTKARMTMMSPYVRARRHVGDVKGVDFLVGHGDHSDSIAPYKEVPGWKHWSMPNDQVWRAYTGPGGVGGNSQGKLLTQNDINKGIYILFGLNTAYGASYLIGCEISQAWMRYTYDMPPTAVITSPPDLSTVSTTSAPVVSWDYADDFQPQAKYQLTIYDNSLALVYDSAVVTSSETIHMVAANLPNGTYTMYVRVYQAWNGWGGDFPSNVAAKSTFTIDMLNLSTPRLSVASVAEHTAVTVYPDVNLMDFDTSTADNGILPWFTPAYNVVSLAKAASPIRDGSHSIACTINTPASTPSISSKLTTIPVVPGNTYKLQAYLNPLALAGRQAQISIRWYNAAGTFLSATIGLATTLAPNLWTQVSFADRIAPATAAWAKAQIIFVGNTAGDVIYVDDAGIWLQVDTNVLPTWTRGGFFESTANLISYTDSTMESIDYTWDVNLTPWPNTNLTLATVSGIHGVNALNITRSATGAGNAGITLGGSNLSFISIDPSLAYVVYAQVKGTGAARSASINVNWYKADQTASATPVTITSVTEVLDTWTTLAGTVTSPADAQYAVISYWVAGVAATTENHLLDAVSFYLQSASPGVQQFLRGFYPNTDIAPTLIVEYMDAGLGWLPLSSQPITNTQGSYVVADYTVKSGVTRSYRASLKQVENSIQLNSVPSASADGLVTLSNVWMHSDDNPAGTTYNFKWDGGGRASSFDALAQMVNVEGRSFPFAQFGTQDASTVDANIHLDNQADISALEVLARKNALVVFRDQRGRSVRGVMGSVKINDAPYGVAQDASFTLQLSGIQP